MGRTDFFGYRLLRLATRKFWAALIIAALTVQLCPRAALAGGEEAAKAALYLEILAMERALLYSAKGIMQETGKMGLYEALLVVEDMLHNYFIDVTYKADHEVLANNDKVFKEQSLAALYASLRLDIIGAGSELSFGGVPSRSDFDKQDPGYRNILSGDVRSEDIVVFSEEYKNRTEGFLDFAYISLKANNSEAKDFLRDSDPLSPKMVTSLDIASFNAGNPMDVLKGDKGGGHRQVMQAGNQIVNFSNQELLRLRVDMNRLSEERARVARNERQEKIDAQAAFDQAVRIWTNTGSGRGY
ncbi:hypothetical protein FACS1894204_04430 [Synergistales bacterium]|nr:hypothetical protein FACS1894204_04430 [Synergistales bacterium]